MNVRRLALSSFGSYISALRIIMVVIITWIIQTPSHFKHSFSIAKWAIFTGILLKIMKESLKIMTKMNIFADNNEKPKYNPRRRNRQYISAKKKGKLTKIGNKSKNSGIVFSLYTQRQLSRQHWFTMYVPSIRQILHHI